MGKIGGSSFKTRSRQLAMARVPVEDVCIIPKTERGHSSIHLPHTLM